MLSDELQQHLRALIGSRLPVRDIAAMNDLTPRAIQKLLQIHPQIERIRVGRTLYVDPMAIALARAQTRARRAETQTPQLPPPPRPRGRPPKEKR
jgi:hypothetical protein